MLTYARDNLGPRDGFSVKQAVADCGHERERIAVFRSLAYLLRGGVGCRVDPSWDPLATSREDEIAGCIRRAAGIP